MMCEFGGVRKEKSVQPRATPLPLGLCHALVDNRTHIKILQNYGILSSH